MVVRRSLYTEEDVEEALARVREGETFAHVARTSSIPLRTLFKKAKDFEKTGSLSGERRGSKPVIPPELEEDLVEWVAAMQRVGLPVGPS
ncbi:hypothetical protein BBJ28_00021355 [Nothophytophthora sp. Chile5]|nr:hypothetical protein BBJ28_00021355 [Nothophytophthora sp. Chile5]